MRNQLSFSATFSQHPSSDLISRCGLPADVPRQNVNHPPGYHILSQTKRYGVDRQGLKLTNPSIICCCCEIARKFLFVSYLV